MTGATMEYMSRKKDQNGISHPRMTLIGILKFDGGTKSEYGLPTWNIWGSKDQNGISPKKKCLAFGAVPKGSALFINQGGYEAGYIRHLSISNLTGDAPNHTYEHG